jgi:cytoskeleton protein RodZ
VPDTEAQAGTQEAPTSTQEASTRVPEAPKAAEPKVKVEPVKTPPPAIAPVPQIAPASSPVAEVKPAIPLEVLQRRPLHLVFDETSWAEVIDVNGTILLSRNVPRGMEKWVGGPGRAPYDISISNPSKVRIYYKGNKIDLTAYAAMEMAHLKVK